MIPIRALDFLKINPWSWLVIGLFFPGSEMLQQQQNLVIWGHQLLGLQFNESSSVIRRWRYTFDGYISESSYVLGYSDIAY